MEIHKKLLSKKMMTRARFHSRTQCVVERDTEFNSGLFCEGVSGGLEMVLRDD
jgi:hypothetical protein